MDGMTASKVQKITFLIFKSLTLRQIIRTFSNEKVRIFSIITKNNNFFGGMKIFDCNLDCNGSRRARCGAGLRLFCPRQTGD